MSNEVNAQEPATQAETQEPTQTETPETANQENTTAETTPTEKISLSAFKDIIEPLTPAFDGTQARQFIHRILLARSSNLLRVREEQNGSVSFHCQVAPSSFSVESATESVLRSLQREGESITVVVDAKGNRLFKNGDHTIILFTETGVKIQASRITRDLRYTETALIAESVRVRRAIKAMKWASDTRIKAGEKLHVRTDIFSRKAALVAQGVSEHDHYSDLAELERTAENLENVVIPQTLIERIAALEDALNLRQAGAEGAAEAVETAKASLVEFVAATVRADFAKRNSLFNLVRALKKIGLVETAHISALGSYIPDLAQLIPNIAPPRASNRTASKPVENGQAPAKKNKKKGKKGGKKPTQPAQTSASDTTDKVVSLDC
jgi:hypothetical protein